MSFLYESITHQVKIIVEPRFRIDQSNLLLRKNIFSYTVSILNTNSFPIHLISRSWLIRDDIGEMSEVQGSGVIGQQPWIDIKKLYTYESFCILKAMSGSMEGFYTFESKDSSNFNCRIPRFYLSSHLLN